MGNHYLIKTLIKCDMKEEFLQYEGILAFCQFKKQVLSVKQKPTQKTVKDITVWATVTFHNGPYKLISNSFKEAKITSSTSILGFPGGLSTKESVPANAGDTGSVLELGRSSGKGSGKPLQYSYLGNPRDRGA